MKTISKNNIDFYRACYTEGVINLVEPSNKNERYKYQKLIQNSIKHIRWNFLRKEFTAIFCRNINRTIKNYQANINDIQKFYDSNLVVAP